MDDKQIINLFFQRDEDAINAVDEKYGSKLNALAANILQSREDGLECVNDTYMKAWNSIPPARPEYLFAFLAASARNIAIDMIRKNNAGKRQAKVVELTKELEECIGDGGLQTHLDKEDMYAAGLDNTSECIFSNDEKNAGVSGVVAGISSQIGDSSVMGQVMAGINVTGEDISKIKYSIMENDSDVTYNLARMKEVDKDSPEYQTSSEKFRKQTENGYAYYIIEDIGEEYEESGNSQSEGIQIVEFSKQLEKESLYQERQVYNEMVKNMYEGLTLSITVTYGDGTTEIVDVGFKEVGGGDNSGKVSDKVAVYVK